MTTSRPSPTLLLPSGRYRVEGRYGLMNVRTVRDIEVKAGQTQQLVFEHEAAAVQIAHYRLRDRPTFHGSSGTRPARPCGQARTRKPSPICRPDATWSGQRHATSATSAAWNCVPARPSCSSSRPIERCMALNSLMSLASLGCAIRPRQGIADVAQLISGWPSLQDCALPASRSSPRRKRHAAGRPRPTRRPAPPANTTVIPRSSDRTQDGRRGSGPGFAEPRS